MSYRTGQALLVATGFLSSPWVVITLMVRPNNLFGFVMEAVGDLCFVVSAIGLVWIRRYAK